MLRHAYIHECIHIHTDVLEQAVATIFVADIRWRLKQHSPLKCRYISSRPHGVRDDSLSIHLLENLKLRELICDLYVTSSRYSDPLRAERSGDRIPVGARFSAPVQTGPDAHPASYTVGTGTLPGVKQAGRGVDHPSPSGAEVKERVKLYPYSPSETSWSVLRWTLPLPLHNQTRTCYALSILRLRHVIWTMAIWRPRKMLTWRQMKECQISNGVYLHTVLLGETAVRTSKIHHSNGASAFGFS